MLWLVRVQVTLCTMVGACFDKWSQIAGICVCNTVASWFIEHQHYHSAVKGSPFSAKFVWACAVCPQIIGLEVE